jgi:beta-lactamase class A
MMVFAKYWTRGRQLSYLLAALAIALPMPIAQAIPPPKMTTPNLSPAQVLERFFKTDRVSTDWFTPAFLGAVPIGQMQAMITQFKQELGALESVTPDAGGFTLSFQQGTVPAQIVLTPDGKISGLLFSPPRQKVASLTDAIAQFKALPGQVSVVVQEGQTVRASLNPSTALGVGSAFKLAVLDTLQTQIAAQELTWQTIVPLQAQFKSLPSGRLQTWPDGTALTVQTLAALMISESDNTATDHLIQLVGRENIEATTPQNQPFLMTRDIFQLKSKGNQVILARYRQGNLAQKRSVLAELAKLPLPNVAEFEGHLPNALDIEWFFTPPQLCKLLDRVSDLPLMGINPGIARSQDWQKVAFKGGSEPGVLNLSAAIQAKNGKRYCVVATWNHDQPLDAAKFMSLYGGLLELLKTLPGQES